MSVVIIEDVWLVARKAHQCWLCSEGIAAGSEYRATTLMDGGAPYHLKEHDACAVVATEWMDACRFHDDYNEDTFWEGLDELIEADLDAIMADCLPSNRARVWRLREVRR